MVHREGNFERIPRVGPAPLDLVKIDGRWAQVSSGPLESHIVFLDDGTTARVQWSDYELTHEIDSHIRLQNVLGKGLSDDEMRRVRWGSEQAEDPDLVQEVHVFGEYTSKTPI